MKRLLLLLGCVAAFSSCLKNDKFERDMTSTGYIIYSSAAKQTLVALDPFNVAFRLNILIAEGDRGLQRRAGRDPAKNVQHREPSSLTTKPAPTTSWFSTAVRSPATIPEKERSPSRQTVTARWQKRVRAGTSTFRTLTPCSATAKRSTPLRAPIRS